MEGFENTGDITTYMFFKEIEEKTKAARENEITRDEVATTHH